VLLFVKLLFLDSFFFYDEMQVLTYLVKLYIFFGLLNAIEALHVVKVGDEGH
jgi:hypothetical protein